MIRIILVDDHATLREALVVLLEREPDMMVVGEAGSVGETRQLLANKVPADVAVVDLTLPDGQGTDVVEALLDSRAVEAVLVLTALDELHDRARAVAAGALGVLHKSVPTADIIVAIRRLHQGEALFTPGQIIELLRAEGEHLEKTAQRSIGAQSTDTTRGGSCPGSCRGLERQRGGRPVVHRKQDRTHPRSEHPWEAWARISASARPFCRPARTRRRALTACLDLARARVSCIASGSPGRAMVSIALLLSTKGWRQTDDDAAGSRDRCRARGSRSLHHRRVARRLLDREGNRDLSSGPS